MSSAAQRGSPTGVTQLQVESFQVGPADRAQPGAVVAAQRSQGKGEQQGVAGQGRQVEMVGAEGVGLLLVLGLVPGPAAGTAPGRR